MSYLYVLIKLLGILRDVNVTFAYAKNTRQLLSVLDMSIGI